MTLYEAIARCGDVLVNSYTPDSEREPMPTKIPESDRSIRACMIVRDILNDLLEEYDGEVE